MKYRLPIVTERKIRMAETARTRAVSRFERKVRTELGTASVSCEKGCMACCHHPVLLSVYEGITLFRWLVDHLMWTPSMQAKFAEAADKTWNLPLEVWLLSLIPCPLLDVDEGECRAYEGRPAHCRVTISTGDPHFCHPHRLGPETGIVDRRSYAQELENAPELSGRVHGVLVPLAKAVLLGEQICKDELDINDVVLTVWRDLKEKG